MMLHIRTTKIADNFSITSGKFYIKLIDSSEYLQCRNNYL